MKSISNLEIIQEHRDRCLKELWSCTSLRKDLQVIYEKEEIMWCQRAKENWVKGLFGCRNWP